MSERKRREQIMLWRNNPTEMEVDKCINKNRNLFNDRLYSALNKQYSTMYNVYN